MHASSTHILRPLGIAATAGWLIAVGSGFSLLHRHEKSPDAQGTTRTSWPATSSLRPVVGRPDIVVAVHPRCPCTRASLQVLAEVLEAAEVSASVRLLVYRPWRSVEGWAGTSWTRGIEHVAGVTVVDDPGGREAIRFGLENSGAIVAYDRVGRWRYSGGLTAGRGSVERSPGAVLLEELLSGRAPGRATGEVFGCPLVAGSAGTPTRGARP